MADDFEERYRDALERVEDAQRRVRAYMDELREQLPEYAIDVALWVADQNPPTHWDDWEAPVRDAYEELKLRWEALREATRDFTDLF